MANPLPDDILVEIFTKLPTKSAGKCRCLSKTWNTYLSTPEFANLHLTSHRNHHGLLFVNENSSLQLITPPLVKNNKEFSKEINLPNKFHYVYGSCNGLVFLMDKKTMQLLVLNPITLKQVIVPLPHHIFNEGYTITYGFGYDPSCYDYIVIRLSCHEHLFPTGLKACIYVDAYYMKKGAWEFIGNCPFEYGCNVSTSIPYFNGVFHWLDYTEHDENVHIVAVNLADKTFHEISYPTNMEPISDQCWLMVLRGCLSLIDYKDNGCADVWIMKEYGVGSSWIRLPIKANVMRRGITPVCAVEDKELICFINNKDLWVLYDLKEGMTEEIGAGGIPNAFFRSYCVFVDSLISPLLSNVST